MRMTHRTTFALDELTVTRLRHLAEVWDVSQAEAVRRAVESAEREVAQGNVDLAERLEAWHRKGGLDPSAARAWMEELAERRADWGRGG